MVSASGSLPGESQPGGTNQNDSPRNGFDAATIALPDTIDYKIIPRA